MTPFANTEKVPAIYCAVAFLALQERVVNQAIRSYLFEVLETRTAHKRY